MGACTSASWCGLIVNAEEYLEMIFFLIPFLKNTLTFLLRVRDVLTSSPEVC